MRTKKIPFNVKWWLGNRNIRVLSPEAKGVVVDIMCLMMEGDPYGRLYIGGIRYDSSTLSKILSIPEKQMLEIINEIIEVGKDIKIDPGGCMYSQYMIRDAETAEKRKQSGALGGNPVLTGKVKLPKEITVIDTPPESNIPENYTGGADPVEEPFYLTKKGRKLKDKQLKAFEIFWEEFNYKASKAEAADSWLDLKVNKDMFPEIIKGARREAAQRQRLIDTGHTPKMAQGWLSSRRWEDGQ